MPHRIANVGEFSFYHTVCGIKIRTTPIDSSSPTLSTPSTIPSNISPFKGLKTRALNVTVNMASPLSFTTPFSIDSILNIVIMYPYLIVQVPSNAFNLLNLLIADIVVQGWP